MATTKKRLNISLSPELEIAITGIAKRDKVPAATKATELLELALEIEEDVFFGRLAEGRIKAGGKRLSHEEVWQ